MSIKREGRTLVYIKTYHDEHGRPTEVSYREENSPIPVIVPFETWEAWVKLDDHRKAIEQQTGSMF